MTPSRPAAVAPAAAANPPAHHNRGLFSDHYLDDVLPRLPEWAGLAAEAGAVRADVAALYARVAGRAAGMREAQLERDFVVPVLERLGHRDSLEVQVALATPDGTKSPDYAFYGDAEGMLANKGAGTLTDAMLLRHRAVAVGDAKAWDLPLDRAVAPAGTDPHLFTNRNPAYQIAFYVEHSGLPWGVLTNGRRWRLVHRGTAQRLDRYYEVDLPELLAADDPTRFLYFYAFFRRAAFVGGPLRLADTLRESADYAEALGASIKQQVFAAVRHLAQGFIDYAPNGVDPAALAADPAARRAVYDHALIVLYRLLFVLYAEARGLLPLRENRDYAADYSLHAITRDTADRIDAGRRRRPNTAHLWPKLTELFRLIDRGDPPLGIATFNGGLFDPAKHPFLEGKAVGDAHLEQALDLITRVPAEQRPGDGRRAFVDYRDLATRHLGTIYEGLLEYHLGVLDAPEPDELGGAFTVALLNKDNERKTSGSFYTPDYVVTHIVEETLGPVVAEAVRDLRDGPTRVAAILDLNVLDPAMGSGHFLVEATEYLARAAAAYDTGYDAGETATSDAAGDAVGSRPADGPVDRIGPNLSEWKRRVAQACIYGVDRNELAVELAKLSLWLATAAKDRPLSFLDHHLRAGNSLVGARLDVMRALQARAPKVTPRAGAKRAKTSSDAAQTSLLEDDAFRQSLRQAVGSMAEIEQNPARTVGDVKRQEALYAEMRDGLVAKYGRALHVVAALQYGHAVDTSLRGALVDYATGRTAVAAMRAFPRYVAEAAAAAEARGFFHWELEFPDVFFSAAGASRGVRAGFDAVVGNPPYEVIAAKERGTAEGEDAAFLAYARADPTYAPVAGAKVDLFRLFLARALELARPGGAAGFIVPMSLMADQQSASLRQLILERHQFVSFDAFPQKDDPKRRVFPEAKLPTCVVRMAAGGGGPGTPAAGPPGANTPDVAAPFRVRLHPGRVFEEVSGTYTTTPADVAKHDPKRSTIPLSASNAATDLVARLYQARGACRMGDLFTSRQGEVNETTLEALGLVSTDATAGPKVLRGSNIRRYRFAPDARQGKDKYLDVARYKAEVGGQRAADTEHARFGYQRNSAIDSSRRLLAAELPVPSYCFDSISYIPTEGAEMPHAWLALLNSDLLEWVFRPMSSNNHVSTAQLHRLPALRPGAAPGGPARARLDALLAEADALIGEANPARDPARDPALAAGLVDGVRRALADAPSKGAAALQGVYAAVAVLDALGRGRVALGRRQTTALEACWLDLDGVLPAGHVEDLRRLWTPPRPARSGGTALGTAGGAATAGRRGADAGQTSTPTAAHAERAERDARIAEAARALGPLAGQVVEFSDLGALTEPQWQALLRRRFLTLPNQAAVMHAYRRHAPGLAVLHRRIAAVEETINGVVYAVFGVTAAEAAEIEDTLRWRGRREAAPAGGGEDGDGGAPGRPGPATTRDDGGDGTGEAGGGPSRRGRRGQAA